MKSTHRSTGPRTEAGKQRSSLNALRHGLTGQTVVLPTEDRHAYEDFRLDYFEHYRPEGPMERQYVQTLIDCAWRLNRLRTHEQNLLCFSSQEFEEQLPGDRGSALGHARAESIAYEKHTKDLGNLSLYEQRITRQMDHAQKQLKALQAQRHVNQQDNMFKASALKAHHDSQQAQQDQPVPYNPQADGFVFSNRAIDAWTSMKDRFLEGLSAEPGGDDDPPSGEKAA